MGKTRILRFISLRMRYLSNLHKARSVALAEPYAIQRDAGHYEVERLPRELVIASIGILPWHFERPSFQTFLI